jgi:glycosyltransferase involved in cell wall biosynthesis
MRIAEVATLAARVMPDSGGSVEGLVWLLTRELTALGHEVTVFGVAGSTAAGEVVATSPGVYGRDGAIADWQLCEWINLGRAVEQSHRFDVIHSHAYLWGMPLAPLSRSPMVHTLHTTPVDDQAHLWSLYPDSTVTAISRFQWSDYPQHTPTAVIHHGIDAAQFDFSAAPSDYVCYLGRFIPQKGPLQAIAAAQALGLRLLLAGPMSGYYQSAVAPLVDGHQVQYVGEVNGIERNKLLGGARALLYPNQKGEPFGLVMAEAMMCGTPVAAMRIGAVSEVIEEGISGYSAASEAEFVAKIPDCFTLDRRRIRATALARFSARRMAQAYEQVFKDVVAAAKGRRT